MTPLPSDSEQSWLTMTQARHLRANALQMVGVDRGDGHTRAHACIGENGAPGINDQRMAVTLSAPIVQPVCAGAST